MAKLFLLQAKSSSKKFEYEWLQPTMGQNWQNRLIRDGLRPTIKSIKSAFGRLYRVIHPNWLKVLSYNFVNKWFYQKMKISHCWKFIDVYAGTLICPRSQFFASQIIFFHSWQWAKIGWLLWSCYTAQFWPAVFVPTQLFNKCS